MAMKNEQNDVARGVESANCSTRADSASFASGGSEGATTAAQHAKATFSVGLSPAEYERLALLSEELGEAIQIVGKILRHGYESTNPVKGDGVRNRELLEDELGDVRFATMLLCESGDLDLAQIHEAAERKRKNVKKWLHFNG